MRRSRKPVRVFRSDEGSNPSLSVSRQVAGLSSPRPTRGSPTSTGRFGLRLPRDFPTAAPCPSPVDPRGAAISAPVSRPAHSRPPSIATTTRYPAITGRLHTRTVACQGAARVLCGGSLPRNCPQLLPVRDVLARHAQRTSPQHRRTAVHARVARSPARGVPTRVRTSRHAAPRTRSYRGRCLRISLPPDLVADANVILPALIGGPRPPRDRIRPRPARTTRIRRRMSANVHGERGAQPDPGAGAQPAALLANPGSRLAHRAVSHSDGHPSPLRRLTARVRSVAWVPRRQLLRWLCSAQTRPPVTSSTCGASTARLAASLSSAQTSTSRMCFLSMSTMHSPTSSPGF